MNGRSLLIKLLLLTALLNFCPESAEAQYDSVRRSDLARLPEAVLHNVAAPIRWNKKSWSRAGAVVVQAVAVSLLDEPVHQFWTNKSDPVLDAVNDVGYAYGKPSSAFIVSSGFYLAGLIIDDDWAKETGLMLATAVITGGLLQGTLKPLAGRARPENRSGNYDFHPFSTEPMFHSFPSGHAVMAFTISFVLAKRINSVPLRILFYSLAASTAICRLYSNAHWFSDVVFGATSSWFIASGPFRSQPNRPAKKERRYDVAVQPYVGGMSLTITLN
jgi:membrane-associated phospholipid phosphatase